MLKLTCDCGKRVSFPESMAGKRGRCPGCGEPFQIPVDLDGSGAVPVVLADDAPTPAAPLPAVDPTPSGRRAAPEPVERAPSGRQPRPAPIDVNRELASSGGSAGLVLALGGALALGIGIGAWNALRNKQGAPPATVAERTAEPAPAQPPGSPPRGYALPTPDPVGAPATTGGPDPKRPPSTIGIGGTGAPPTSTGSTPPKTGGTPPNPAPTPDPPPVSKPPVKRPPPATDQPPTTGTPPPPPPKDPTPKTVPTPELPDGPLPFADAERTRAVGLSLTLELTDGTQVPARILGFEGRKLSIARGPATVGVSLDRLSFGSLYALKRRACPRSDGPGWVTVALHALKAGRGELARDAVRTAIDADAGLARRLEPYRPMLMRMLAQQSAPLLKEGQEYVKSKEYGLAASRFRAARELYDGPEANDGLGSCYFFQRKIDEALECFERALKANPKYLGALLNRGYVYFFEQDYEKAKADYDRALALAPTNRMAKYFAGIVAKVMAGPGWAKTYDKKSRHYFLSTDKSQAYADKMSKELEAVYKAYDRNFKVTKRKNTKLRFRVLIFAKRESYAKYVKGVTGSHFAATQSAGLYSPLLKQLLLFERKDALSTLYHEGFHQFLDYFLENPPRWFNEGLGEVFEVAENTGRGFIFGKVNRGDLNRVRQAVRRNKEIKLKDLLKMPPQQFYQKAQATYPQAWATCYFFLLAERGRYRPLFTKYFRALLKGKAEKTAYEEVFGKLDMDALHAAWRKFVNELK